MKSVISINIRNLTQLIFFKIKANKYLRIARGITYQDCFTWLIEMKKIIDQRLTKYNTKTTCQVTGIK